MEAQFSSVIVFSIGGFIVALLLFLFLVENWDKIKIRINEFYSCIDWEWIILWVIVFIYMVGWIITRPLHKPYKHVHKRLNFFTRNEVIVFGKVISIIPEKEIRPDWDDNRTFIVFSHEVPVFILKIMEIKNKEEIIINVYHDEKTWNEINIEVGCNYKFTCVKHWRYKNLIFSEKKLY